MLIPNNIISSKGEHNYLEVNLKVISSLPPLTTSYTWDLGDGSNPVMGKSINHSYDMDGIYMVHLRIAYINENNESKQKDLYKVLVLTNKSKTQLDGSIYDLVYSYIPKDITSQLSVEDINFFINKWQLYIYELVDHDIPDSEYNNELYYEALENVLIMQLAAYEATIVSVFNLLQSITNIISSTTGESEGGEESTEVMVQSIKRIVTGPTETEFFDTPDSVTDSEANMIKNITSAFRPGGMIDVLKENICMLSERTKIVLTIICRDIQGVKVPRKSRTYRPGTFKGPNNGKLVRRKW